MLELDRDVDGMTVREHCEKAGGVDEPQLSPALEHLWKWFNELKETRDGGFGPNPISHREIKAWAHNTCSDPNPWEVNMLRKIDREWMKFVTAKKDETGS